MSSSQLKLVSNCYPVSMGKKSHATPTGFATELNAYLRHVLDANGKQDLSGRWLAEVTDGARARDYWSALVKDERAMTTNDIDVLAETFGMSAFDFVRNARALASSGEAPAPIVGALDEDWGIAEDPGDELPQAAETPREPRA